MSTKNWVFTIFATAEEEPTWLDGQADPPLDLWKAASLTFLIFQMELCPTTHRKHLQGFVQLKKRGRMSAVKKVFSRPDMHLEMMRGTSQEASDYSSKTETRIAGPWTFGELVTQGKRTDLDEVVEAISNGASKRKIALEYPSAVVKFSRGLDVYRHAIDLSPRWRTLNVVYLWGPTGVGKTRFVWDTSEEPSDLYKVEGDGQWWDGYDGQATILFDDFNGQVPITKMLSWLDGYPLQVPIKGSFVWAKWVNVYITANIPLRSQYRIRRVSALNGEEYFDDELRPEIRAAFNRRITITRFKGDIEDVWHDNQ